MSSASGNSSPLPLSIRPNCIGRNSTSMTRISGCRRYPLLLRLSKQQVVSFCFCSLLNLVGRPGTGWALSACLPGWRACPSRRTRRSLRNPIWPPPEALQAFLQQRDGTLPTILQLLGTAMRSHAIAYHIPQEYPITLEYLIIW